MEIRYVAENGTTGYAIAAGRLVAALRAAGHVVEFHSWHDGAPHPHSRDERRQQVGRDALTVMHLVPEHLPAVSARFGGPVVVHTVWETDTAPGHWPWLLNQSAGVLVPTEWNREVFRRSGVAAPIEVIPHVAAHRTGAPAFDIDPRDVVFYAISRWDERKAPGLALQAYLEAFDADDPVVFVLKTGMLIEAPPPDAWGRDSQRYFSTDLQVARLIRGRRRPPRIELFVEEWDDERIASLHARGDCYLTLTHGEGWGLGSFDACAHGTPVIATGWGGHLDYLEGSPLLVEHDLVAVAHSAAGSYSADQRWAQPDTEHAARLMRSIAADPAGARAAAAPLRDRLFERFAPAVVAARFSAAIESMSGSRRG